MTITTPATPRRMSAGHMLALVAGVLIGAAAPVALYYDQSPLISVAAVLAGIALIIVGATGLGRSIQLAGLPAARPIALEGTLDPKLSRWMWLVKWLLAIPHFAVLVILWIAFVVVTIAAGFAILFTGRYPAPLFEFANGVLRWNWRVAFYANGVLGSDSYPPFTLARTDYPATFEVAAPDGAVALEGAGQVLAARPAAPHHRVARDRRHLGGMDRRRGRGRLAARAAAAGGRGHPAVHRRLPPRPVQPDHGRAPLDVPGLRLHRAHARRVPAVPSRPGRSGEVAVESCRGGG